MFHNFLLSTTNQNLCLNIFFHFFIVHNKNNTSVDVLKQSEFIISLQFLSFENSGNLVKFYINFPVVPRNYYKLMYIIHMHILVYLYRYFMYRIQHISLNIKIIGFYIKFKGEIYSQKGKKCFSIFTAILIDLLTKLYLHFHFSHFMSYYPRENTLQVNCY